MAWHEWTVGELVVEVDRLTREVDRLNEALSYIAAFDISDDHEDQREIHLAAQERRAPEWWLDRVARANRSGERD